MAGSIKLIKRRLRSIDSTAKLTKAMQMIATVNMRKAVSQARLATPFASETIGFLTRFAKFIEKNKVTHPLLQEQPVNRVLALVVTSNRGLCGSFHTQLEKKIRQLVAQPEQLLHYPFDEINPQDKNIHPKIEFDWIVVGRKGEKMVRHLNQPIIASFSRLNEDVDHHELSAIVNLVKTEFASGKYQKVVIFYTQYVNTLRQVPLMRQLLPISRREIRRISDSFAENSPLFTTASPDQDLDYLIEPNQDELLANIFLLIVKMIIYHAVIESKASVESARMLAMKNATDAASEMKDILTLTYNQLRQSKITQEIAEISAGRAALE